MSAFEVKHRNSLENDALNDRDHAHTNKQTKTTNNQDEPNERKGGGGGLEKPFLHYRQKDEGLRNEVMVRKRFTSVRYPRALAAASIVKKC